MRGPARRKGRDKTLYINALEAFDFRIQFRIPKPKLVGLARPVLPAGGAVDRLRAFRCQSYQEVVRGVEAKTRHDSC